MGELLARMRLEQFVIVEEAIVAFGPELNAVTGETGTGKSILIDAIGFLAGGRGDPSWIREGAEALAVEGWFDLRRLPRARAVVGTGEAAGRGEIAGGGEIRIRRELSRGGRSRAWIEDRSVRVAELRDAAAELISIHGQGEHRRLLDPVAQLEILDRYGGSMELREAYRAARGEWLQLVQEGASIRSRLADLSEKEEWHRFQFEEIEAAEIEIGEEERLREERDRIAERRRSLETHAELERILFEEEGSALDRIETALAKLERLGGPEWEEPLGALRDARDRLRQTRRTLLPLEMGDDDAAGRIETRLDLLSKLKRKYGGSEGTILDRRGRLAALLEETAHIRERDSALGAEIARARDACGAVAVRLGAARRDAAPGLAAAVTREIRGLGMAGADLTIRVDMEEAEEDEPHIPIDGIAARPRPDGCDRAIFLLRPNPGEGAGPLGEIASGGELSRALLAILTVLGRNDEPHTAIFDEVDAGIGGATAAAVARRLARLARDRQVLLVTHLPVVASRASTHLRVEKKTVRGRTRAVIDSLDREGRIGELARMLAGEVDSRIAREHAEALMEAASSTKEDG